ncbi:double-strand break repair helicase AddA [Lentibacter algarum]|uniref:double-strand break repair helicase AddA n=1 Tax=Lentibacter algarum TaxID=576131 RepID=UPI001C07E7F0|nr:double-strand break repair helicase AddA [Lentibacter algarum]MBU2980355.1 double-strand break repair helicase AddA [Lentibacter algarum]
MKKLPHEASVAQIVAADPSLSTWLSANAGSGKTRVLTDRVARLLLKGVSPQNVLCLTYTKAAASEMQNRLFKRLGSWAMRPNETLRKELEELGEVAADAETLANARRLFARAIETPGGLRIQTIHSFCAALLRRFPLEAGVSPQFAELDDRTAAQLREQVLDTMAASATDASLVRGMAQVLGGSEPEKLTQQIVSNKAKFEKPMTLAMANELFQLPAQADENYAASIALDGSEESLVEACLSIRGQTTSMYQKFIDALQSAVALPDSKQTLEALYKICLYSNSNHDSKSSNFPQSRHTAAVKVFEPVIEELHALMDRVHDAKHVQLALVSVQKTLALHKFARQFLWHYETLKAQRGWLDFDDLIHKTKELLTDSNVAQWVLYRLDGGIDHILVDEAQDTSPEQWSVIEELAREITSGDGAREADERTIFVVGDKKQSIYSFQGADSREFDRMREEFSKKLAHRSKPLNERSLAYSFRSSPAILSLVDQVFADRPEFGVADNERHIAFHHDMPGRVDIWPVVEKTAKDDGTPWYNPVDLLSPADPVSILAENIALNIRTMIDDKQLIPTEKAKDGTWQGRPVHEGDFLILMQRRSPLFHEIIRACKAKGLDVAGADRLKVGEEIAVKDITALLSFLATESDDLSLAAALRSPIFGWSEQQLFTLAHGRKGGLWEALRKASDKHPQTFEILKDLRDQADFARPYELIERMLTRHGARQRFLKRLGHEAEDAIDAFLSQALSFERFSVPSLTGFLSWLASDDPEVKRQMESGGKRIRVMTVHGSKGLESPIVIMPDTADRKTEVSDHVLASNETALWKQPKTERPEILREVVKQKEAALVAERERLLYVSMTRAEKWLIVAAAGAVDKEDSWMNRVLLAAEQLPFDSTTNAAFKRYEVGDWGAIETVSNQAKSIENAALEGYFQLPAPQGLEGPKPLSPSDLGGAKALAGETGQDEETALRYGTEVHLLLEVLPGFPAAQWEQVAGSILGESYAQQLTEARLTLEAPHLAHLFANGTLGEVPLSAPSKTLGARMHGIIDRLVISDNAVLIVDYKTNRSLPANATDTPQGLLRQMGAYAEATAQIWPNKTISTAILWTKTAELMPLDHDLVIKALRDTPHLDVRRAAS